MELDKEEFESLYGMHGILLIHFMYTDDLVVFSLSSAGLQRLFHIRSPYCMTFNMISDTMSVKERCRFAEASKESVYQRFPELKLSDNHFNVCNKVRYLGCLASNVR